MKLPITWKAFLGVATMPLLATNACCPSSDFTGTYVGTAVETLDETSPTSAPIHERRLGVPVEITIKRAPDGAHLIERAGSFSVRFPVSSGNRPTGSAITATFGAGPRRFDPSSAYLQWRWGGARVYLSGSNPLGDGSVLSQYELDATLKRKP